MRRTVKLRKPHSQMSVAFRQAVEEKRWQRFKIKKLREEAVDDGNEYVVLSH